MSEKTTLSQEDLQIITQTAIKVYEIERVAKIKEARDKRFHNTKLLLKHYRDFKTHVGEEQLQEDVGLTFDDILSEFDDESELVQSIKRTKERTSVILKHIDTMLCYYEIACERSDHSEDLRRWRIIKSMYIDSDTTDYSVDDLAELYSVDKRTIYRDVNEAARTLSVLFFGIDGLQR